MSTKLSEFFDITLRDQLDVTFQSLSSDKFFVFSGPPKFNILMSDKRYLCPLLFTQSFSVNESQAGGPRLGSIGTTTVIDMPSTQGSGTIQIGYAAVVTGEPKVLLGTAGGSQEVIEGSTSIGTSRWDFIKRLYYDTIMFTDTNGNRLINYFLPTENEKSKKSSLGFNVVGKSVDDIFTNFGKSEFYQLPFGMLVVMLTKGNTQVTTRYYEGCKLYQKGGTLMAQAGAPAGLHPGGLITYTEEMPLDLSSVGFTEGVTDKEFMNTLREYIGSSN